MPDLHSTLLLSVFHVLLPDFLEQYYFATQSHVCREAVFSFYFHYPSLPVDLKLYSLKDNTIPHSFFVFGIISSHGKTNNLQYGRGNYQHCLYILWTFCICTEHRKLHFAVSGSQLME